MLSVIQEFFIENLELGRMKNIYLDDDSDTKRESPSFFLSSTNRFEILVFTRMTEVVGSSFLPKQEPLRLIHTMEYRQTPNQVGDDDLV